MNQSIELALMHTKGFLELIFVGWLCPSCGNYLLPCFKIGDVWFLGSAWERALGFIIAQAANRLLIICCEQIAHVNWPRFDRLSLVLISVSMLQDDLSDGGKLWGISSLPTV